MSKVKDLSYRDFYNRVEVPIEDEQTTLCILVDHYYDQKTIPLAEAERLKELITSPDKENMEVAKVLLQQKYHILK